MERNAIRKNFVMKVVCIDDYPFPKMGKNPDKIEIFLTLGKIYEIMDNGSESSFKLCDDSGKIVILSKRRFVELEKHRQEKLDGLLK
jgi:hypothetical protein